MINFPLTTNNYLLDVQIKAALEGIIIVDVTPGFTLPDNETSMRIQLPVNVEVMDFEFDGSAMRIIDASETTLTPTVKTTVSGFSFNADSKTIRVLGSRTSNAVHTASSETSIVQVRVNFSTATITVFE